MSGRASTAGARGATRRPGSGLSGRDLTGTARFVLALLWRADRRRLVAVVTLQLASAAGLAAVVLVLHRVLGGVLGSDAAIAERPYVLPGIGAIVLLATVGGVSRAVSQSLQRVLAIETDREATGVVLDAAAGVDLHEFERPEFHDRLQRALFASRMQPSAIVMSVAAGLQAVLGVVAVGIAFVGVVWWLLPVCLVAFVPVVRAARNDRDVRHELQRTLAEGRRSREYLERLLSGRDEAKEVRAFGLGPTLRARWQERVTHEVAEIAAGERGTLRRRIQGRLASDAVVLAVIAGAWLLVANGRLPLAAALTALMALWLLSTRVQSLGFLMTSVGDSLLYLDDLRTFADTSSAARSGSDGAAATERGRAAPRARPGPAELRTDGLWFTYPGAATPALRGVDVRIGPGEVVALVGANGSGKSTLAKVLSGTYHQDDGRVCLDGRPVDDPAILRDRTAVLFQDFVRFRLPALDNITFGRPERPVERQAIDEAVRRSGSDDLITGLPGGLDTVLAPEYTGGSDLSLGQWQRLSLARAFYRDAPTVVLDEPTASLDPDAEADLFDRLREVLAGRSVVFISHRFSSVRGADRIYVLDGGRIAETGDHDTLMRLGGTYARMFGRQAEPYLEGSLRQHSPA